MRDTHKNYNCTVKLSWPISHIKIKWRSIAMEITGPILPTRLVTGYVTMDVRLWTILLTILILHPVTCISLKPFRSAWPKNLQQMLTWGMLSPPGYRHFTLISSTPQHKPWYHGGTNASMLTVITSTSKVYSTTYGPCAMHTSEWQSSPLHHSVCYSIF
jgi:hypothetical protein